MLCTMKGQLIEKAITESPDLGSVVDAAKKIKCDPRTLGSAIRGLPVLLSTATIICKILGLNTEEAIISHEEGKALHLDIDKYIKMSKEIGESEYISEAAMTASMAGGDAIAKTLKRYNADNLSEVTTTLSLIILSYATELILKDPSVGYSFMDDISNRVKSSLDVGLGNDFSETTTTTDEERIE